MDTSIKELRKVLLKQAANHGVKADSKMTNEGAIDLCSEVMDLRTRLSSARVTEGILRWELLKLSPREPVQGYVFLPATEPNADYFIYTKVIPIKEETARHCCLALDELMSRYDLPFSDPVVIGDDGCVVKIETGMVSVKLTNKTPAGNISRRNQASLLINFCPFCGERLKTEEVE